MVCESLYKAKNASVLLKGEQAGLITSIELTIGKEFDEKDVIGRPVPVNIPIRNNLTGSLEKIMFDTELIGFSLGRNVYDTFLSGVVSEIFDTSNVCLWTFCEDRQVLDDSSFILEGAVLAADKNSLAQLMNAKGDQFAANGFKAYVEVAGDLDAPVPIEILVYRADNANPSSADIVPGNLLGSGAFEFTDTNGEFEWQTLDLSVLIPTTDLMTRQFDNNKIWMVIRNTSDDPLETIELKTSSVLYNPTGDFPSATLLEDTAVADTYVAAADKAIAFLNMYEREEQGFEIIVEFDANDETRIKLGKVKFTSNNFTISPTEVTLNGAEFIAEDLYFWDKTAGEWVLSQG